MTRTIKSQTSNKYYFLTIDETGHAVDCTCPDCQFRHRSCKHQRNFNQEVERAVAFTALKSRYDCRENGDLATRRCYFEMALSA
jgi:hypothetical protein